jgi:hypothetical protein
MVFSENVGRKQLIQIVGATVPVAGRPAEVREVTKAANSAGDRAPESAHARPVNAGR